MTAAEQVKWCREYINRTYGGASSVNLSYSAGVPVPIITTTVSAICPDLLRYEQIGEADGFRGRVVRAFFWLLRAWKP